MIEGNMENHLASSLFYVNFSISIEIVTKIMELAVQPCNLFTWIIAFVALIDQSW